MTKNTVGLDFGHGVIRAAEVAAGSGSRRPALVRYHEVEVPVDAIKEGVVADVDAVVAALKWLWAVAGFSTKRVLIGMGSQQVLIRELVLPSMPMAHLRETLPFRVQELLPLPVEHAVLDYYPIAEVEHEGEAHIRGLLVAATRESVLANADAVRRAGLKAVDVDLIPFAVLRSAAGSPDAGAEMHHHVGAVSTSVIVSDGGVPQFIRMLPTGGADVTSSLAEQMDLRPDSAEELKRRFGLVADPDEPASASVAAITADAARDLAQVLRSTIAFWENAHDGSSIGAVVLSGGGAMLRGLPEALHQATGLTVRLSRADSAFTLGAKVDEVSFLAAGAAPVVALGLTMRSAA